MASVEAAFASQQGVLKPSAMLAWHQLEGSPDFAQPTLTASSSATRKLTLENYVRVICFYQPEYWNQGNTHTHAQMHAGTHAWRHARTYTHTHTCTFYENYFLNWFHMFILCSVWNKANSGEEVDSLMEESTSHDSIYLSAPPQQ